jgi:putative DNA primase/helicase
MNALRNMAAALGGDVVNGKNGAFVLCPGPGHSAGDRSLSVKPAKTTDGFVCHSFADNDWRTCRDHVSKRLGRSVQQWQPAARPAPTTGSDNSSAAVALLKAGRDPRKTLVERYLETRDLELPDDIAMRVVRFHPDCPWRDNDGAIVRRPAMLTAFRSIATDDVVAVQRTLLSPDARKIDRRMLGPVAGAAIKIDPDENVESGLTICEGFETGLAGHMLGFRPIWALGSAGAIGAFPVLPGVDALTILAETDDSGANARVIRTCGNRWAAAKREIIVATPRIAGDMNDVVRA